VTPARLRRRSTIGAFPVVVMMLAHRAVPGTYLVAESVARAARFGPRSAVAPPPADLTSAGSAVRLVSGPTP
jgi:hypothetical protein